MDGDSNEDRLIRVLDIVASDAHNRHLLHEEVFREMKKDLSDLERDLRNARYQVSDLRKVVTEERSKAKALRGEIRKLKAEA